MFELKWGNKSYGHLQPVNPRHRDWQVQWPCGGNMLGTFKARQGGHVAGAETEQAHKGRAGAAAAGYSGSWKDFSVFFLF